MVVHKIEDGIKRPASQRLQPRAGYDFLYLLIYNSVGVTKVPLSLLIPLES